MAGRVWPPQGMPSTPPRVMREAGGAPVIGRTVPPPPGSKLYRPAPPQIARPARLGPYFPRTQFDPKGGSMPVHVSAKVTLQSNTTQPANTDALRNPLNLPMEIHEIKFQLRGPTGASTAALTGGTMACRLELGSEALTQGLVPIWNFCRSLRADLAEFN